MLGALSIGFGAAAASATTSVVLEQNWDTGGHPLYSQIPASATNPDPLTGKPDQWLIFSGGRSAMPGSSEGGETGSPDTSAETPQLIGEPYGPDNPEADAHNFWHVQEDPQNVCLANPALFPDLVTLGPGDNGCFLPPVSPPNDLSFSQVSGTQSSGFCGANFALLEANQTPKSGCDSEAVEVGSVISPPFNLTGASSALLHMESWFDIESVDANVFDVMEVEYTTEEGTAAHPFQWHSLGALNPISNPAGEDAQDNTNNGFLTAPSWAEIEVDLQPVINEGVGLNHVRLRFAFDTYDNLYNGFRGWNIDNLHVETPFNAPAPVITGVQSCVGNNLATSTSIQGSNFLLSSKVSVDGGEPEEAQTPSASLIEIPVISTGTHTLQVIDPNGTVKSNVFTVDQPASCQPTETTTTTTATSTPAPPPPPPPPAATSENGLGAPAPTCAEHSITLAGSITVEASCFHVKSGGQLTTTGHVRVNGLDLVLSGAGAFTLDTKSLTLSAKGEVDAYAGSLHIYHGTLSWKFKKKLELGVPKNFKIKGLPVGGNAALSLAPGGVNVAVNATVGRSPYKVSGEIDLKVKLATGLELSSFRLELASDLPIKSLVVHKASLAYNHEGSNDVWTGAVEVELPDKGPTVAGKLVVTNGKVSEVALDVSGINKPLGEVVFLQSLGLEVSFAPKLSATGSIGLSAGPAIDGHTAAELDGSLTAEIGEPFVLDAKGTLSLVEKQLAEAEVKATIPGGVAFNGKLTASFLVIDLEGTLKGEVTSKSFYAQGGVTIHAPLVSANGDGLVNNVGLAGCASAKIGATVFGRFIGKTVTVGGAHRWSGQNSMLTDSCGFGGLHSALSSAVRGSGTAVSVPSHTRQLNLIVRGASGPPEVELSEGGATATVVPDTTGALGRTVYLAIGDPADSETDIAIAEPPAGTITVSSPAGQAPLVSVSSALPLPKPDVRVRVRHLRGRRYRLAWSARAIPGQRLVFEDSDARGASEVLSTASAHGRTDFTSLDNGASGEQRIRIVVEQEGLVREVRSGPAFHPPPVRLKAPWVHVRLRGPAAVITWSAVRGAARYYVSVATSDGRHLFFALGLRRRSLRLRGARSVTARVWGVDGGFERGAAGHGRADAKRATRRRKHRGRRRKRRK